MSLKKQCLLINYQNAFFSRNYVFKNSSDLSLIQGKTQNQQNLRPSVCCRAYEESLNQKSAHSNHSSLTSILFRRKCSTEIATRKSEKITVFRPKIGQFSKFFKNPLEFDKTHRNTYLVQISAYLDLFSANYDHFQLKFCPILYI